MTYIAFQTNKGEVGAFVNNLDDLERTGQRIADKVGIVYRLAYAIVGTGKPSQTRRIAIDLWKNTKYASL